ncbi:DUF3870 domain-containing protein [Kribbella sp. NBC_00709]|uniref:DUF3870 domain-containing protein n=1 Tax=Kribbella sp. NBC_00709 TaxID=2975972 RepID=UPI002E2E414B|nr:DUF3870 domain-containing protein [Kribbella sp. NBC_00709]
MDSTASMVVVGYAKVPLGSALRATHEFLSVVFLVDKESHRILEVDSTAVSGAVRRWLADLLLGRDLSRPVDDALTVIEENYLGHASGAIRQAVSDAARRYAVHLTTASGGEQ